METGQYEFKGCGKDIHVYKFRLDFDLLQKLNMNIPAIETSSSDVASKIMGIIIKPEDIVLLVTFVAKMHLSSWLFSSTV